MMEGNDEEIIHDNTRIIKEIKKITKHHCRVLSKIYICRAEVQ